MNRRLLLALPAIASAAGLFPVAAARALDARDRTIIPNQRVGAITRATRPNELARIFGKAAVRYERVAVAEGEEEPGAFIHHDTPDALQVVFTADSARIDSVHILGSNWRTRSGIRLGTPLAELERINGAPFQLSGFGWDHGGVVMPGPKGKLPKDLEIRVQPTKEAPSTDYDQVTGDRKISSRHPVLQKLDVRVHMLTISFSR